MSVPETPRVVSHAPRAVDLGAIENALKQLWKPPGHKPGEQEPYLRACMANLLIYCATGCDADAVTDELHAIVRVQPSRLILLVGDTGDAADELNASVSAHCHLGGDGNHICSEQITIRAAHDAVGRLPSTARSLLVGDLPTSLWWVSEIPPPLGGEVFDELRAMTDQIVYSSAAWTDPVRGTLATAAWAAGALDGGRALADIAWRRLAPWRRLTGQTLDPSVLPGALERIDRIEIEHGSHGLPQAWLLAGWLASRLRWQPQRGVVRQGQDVLWTFQTAAGPVQVRLRRNNTGEPGVVRLAVGWDAGGTRATVSFAPSGDGRLAAESPALGPEPRTVVLPALSRAALVAAELQDLVPDPIFLDALEVSRQMAESLAP